MKLIKFLLPVLFATLFFVACPTWAEKITFSVNDIWYTSYDGKNAGVDYDPSGKTKYTGNIVIPEKVSYNGTDYVVISIYSDAFKYASITSIQIPNTVTYIGYKAFDKCALKSIRIPRSVTEISWWAFYECNDLKSVQWDADSCMIEEGGYHPFYMCPIENLKFGDNVRYIPDWSFVGLEITSVTIPQGVTSIGDGTFYNCKELTNVVFPRDLKSIGAESFSGTGLTSVKIPEDVSEIGSRAFESCPSLAEINLPKGLKKIGECAFRSTGLTSVVIPQNVLEIGAGAFDSCYGLTEIDLPKGLKKIGECAFRSTGLTSVVIPQSVSEMGGWAFSLCANLKSIQWNADSCVTTFDLDWSDYVPYGEDPQGGFYTMPKCLFFRSPVESIIFGETVRLIPNYCCAYMSIKSIKLPESITMIGDGAFSSCYYLTSINIPDNVSTIGDGAFNDCQDLSSVNIPDKVISIGMEAFRSCALTSIEIPYSVRHIGERTFYDCENLSSVKWNADSCAIIGRGDYSTNSVLENALFSGCPVNNFVFGNSVRFIPDSCCFNMASLTSIEIPSSVRQMGSRSFRNCKNFSSVTWNADSCKIVGIIESAYYFGDLLYSPFYNSPINSFSFGKNVRHIPNSCLANMESISSVSIPDGALSIGNNAFCGTALTKIDIPQKVTVIGKGAFSGTRLIAITIPDGVSRIEDYCFMNCRNLESINLPKGLESIGERGFFFCPMSSIEMPKSVKSIGREAFYSSNLISIDIPEGVTVIPYAAFDGCPLSQIKLPSTITHIEHSAFNTVSAFPDIYCEAVVPPHVESSSFQYIGDIYVPCGSKEAYKEAEYWRYYSYRIRCINAEPAYVETKEPTVNPSDVSVVISWRSEAYAQKYVINVTWNGKQFCTVTFDKNGNILTFDFNSNPESRSAELRAANATANGLQYKVTNLSENTEYAYTVSAINASDKVIKEYTGKFTTLGGADNVEEQLAENFSFDKSIVVNDKTISVVGKENSDICIYNIAGKQVTNPVPTAGVYVVTDGNNTSKILVK